MSNLVIVAIPDENDRVWKVSSEKIPHLTVLFLGDVDQISNTDQITQFVEHAANTMLGRFYLPVDRRGELGADKADVLFFKKGRYDYKAIRDFRVQLLKDSNIRTAYDSSTQFEGPWQPHLTLGYPTAPAKPDPDSYPFYDVSFNKIAVWFGDFEGPEFLLKDPWDEMETMDAAPIDIAMSDVSEAGAAYLLKHHGVKGMHWGVRNAPLPRGASAAKKQTAELHGQNAQGLKVALGGQFALLSPTLRANTTKHTKTMVALFGNYAIFDPKVGQDLRNASKKVNLQKADSQWEKGLHDGSAYIAVQNHLADHFNSKIGGLNDKYPSDRDWSKEDYNSPKDPTFKKYVKDVHKLTKESIEHSVSQLNLDNPSGTKTVKVEQDPKEPLTFKMTVHDKEAQHAAQDSPELTFRVVYKTGAKGEITGFKIDDGQDKLTQSAEDGAEFLVFNGMMDPDEFLNHFGVKGMHWGVQKAKAAAKAVGRGVKAVGRGLAALGANLADSSWQTSTYSDVMHEAVHNHVAKELDNRVERLQKSPKYAGKDLKADSDLRKEYYQDVAKVSSSAYRRGVKEVYGENYTGTKTAHYVTDARGPRIEVRDKATGKAVAEAPLTSKAEIKRLREAEASAAVHAATAIDFPDLNIELKLDDNDQISGVGFVPVTQENIMTQSVEMGASFLMSLGISDESLEHYGVKGMHWGVRKPPPSAVDASAASRVPHGARRKTKIDVRGGENHPAHEDAIAVAEARAKLKKSGTAALSNAELQKMAKRLQLETQVAQLTSSRGQKFIQRQLEQTGQQQVQLGLRSAPTVAKKVAKKAGKAAATTAVTVALI